MRRLDVGGLENGVVNLVNRLPSDFARNVIVCLSGYSSFKERVRGDVEVFSIDKREGKDLNAYTRLWRLLRELAPAIVHTRNLGTIDCAPIAWLAGIPCRVHGEHGWDLFDRQGSSLKYRALRKLCGLAINHYVAVSRDLHRWQIENLGIPRVKTTYIPNGVDTDKFRPDGRVEDPVATRFGRKPDLVFGWVGRMHAIKNPVALVEAFALVSVEAARRELTLGLVLLGDGALRPDVEAAMARHGIQDTVWLPGVRSDVDSFMRAFDVFVLPSLNEGMSNTILEAMASGVPVVAAQVGGNAELVPDGRCGFLAQDAAPSSLARAMLRYVAEPSLAKQQGRAARAHVLAAYPLPGMVEQYRRLYERLIQNPQNS